MKNTAKHVVWSVVITLLILCAVPLIAVTLGAVNMAASVEPGPVESKMATLTVARSVAARAPAKRNLFADDDRAVSTGLMHFRGMCLQCHGAPQIAPDEFARGLNPPAPELSAVLHEWSDGELFWIIKHGIRMTGMPAFGPTHTDEDIWKTVAFVRRLPDLTPQQRDELRSPAGDRHSHDDADAHHDSGRKHPDHQASPRHQHNSPQDSPGQ